MAIYADAINSGLSIYSIGETIELVLELDQEGVPVAIPATLNVTINDRWDNPIGTAIATLIGGSLFSVAYKIPRSLVSSYNITAQVDSDKDFFYLYDKWELPDGSFVQFDFRVYKAPLEQPISDNSRITLSFKNLEAVDPNIVFSPIEISFATRMSPYYSTVEDVRAQNKEFLQDFDDYEVAAEIVIHSQEVDLTMAPNYIARPATYDYAVSQWVGYSTAYSLISSGAFNNVSEDKEIDTFKVSVTRNEKANVLKHILQYIADFALIVTAGGLDTPFRTATFVKGIFDPNRTNIARANMDTSDNLPYLNKTTQSFAVTNADGSSYEIRGSHTVAYLGFRTNIMGGASSSNAQGSSNFIPAEVNYAEAWSHD